MTIYSECKRFRETKKILARFREYFAYNREFDNFVYTLLTWDIDILVPHNEWLTDLENTIKWLLKLDGSKVLSEDNQSSLDSGLRRYGEKLRNEQLSDLDLEDWQQA